MDHNEGIIYQITHNTTGLSYIGQCKNFKYKDGKPYRYGLSGRWSDHCASARPNGTPFQQAIAKDGRESFSMKILDQASIEDLDALEADYINQLGTLYPSGYNVMRHGRVKFRSSTNIASYYLELTMKGRAAPINKDGHPRYVRVYLDLITGERVRLMFGTGKDETFTSACLDARNFADEFLEVGIPFPLHLDDQVLVKYADKIDRLQQLDVERIRISTVKTRLTTLLSLFFRPSNARSYKDEIRVCFGGKHISRDQAIETSIAFIQQLDVDDDKIVIADHLTKPEVRNRWPPLWLKEIHKGKTV